MSQLKCPRCGSTDIKVYEDHYTCNICGEKFNKIGEVTSEDIEKVFFTSTSLRAEVKKQYKDFIERSDKEARDERFRNLRFSWEKHGNEIPLMASIAFMILAGLSLVSMNSYMALPYAGASIISGLVYVVMKRRKKGVYNDGKSLNGGGS